MIAVEFPEQNCVHTKEDCYDLPTLRRHNNMYGIEEVISCWEFSDEELIRILKDVKNGIRPQIFLSVLGGQPPVSLFMRGEENARND